MTAATSPTQPLFIHWRRCVDMRLLDYSPHTTRTIRDAYGVPARFWWALWRKGCAAGDVADWVSEAVNG